MLSEIGFQKDLSQEHDYPKHLWKNFIPQNLAYCKQLIDTISSMLPKNWSFFYEAGIHYGTGKVVYGSSLEGTPAIEVIRGNHKGENITLNLLCG